MRKPRWENHFEVFVEKKLKLQWSKLLDRTMYLISLEISLRREYFMNVNINRIFLTAVLTGPAKNDPICSILLSKIAKILAWNKLKLFKGV